jgi:hypothetical protein
MPSSNLTHFLCAPLNKNVLLQGSVLINKRAAFALTPAATVLGVIDYNTSEGRKL